jgi:hypothetical protein
MPSLRAYAPQLSVCSRELGCRRVRSPEPDEKAPVDRSRPTGTHCEEERRPGRRSMSPFDVGGPDPRRPRSRWRMRAAQMEVNELDHDAASRERGERPEREVRRAVSAWNGRGPT